MEVVDPAKPEVQLGRACSFGPQGWPWWDDEDLGDPATPVLLARDDYPGAGIRPGLRGMQGVQSAKLQDAGRHRKKGRTDRPFQKLYIDFLGKYPRSKSGHAWIIIVVDHFFKYTFLKAIRRRRLPT